jgi:uncharacterized protein (DUF2236 family)
MLRALTLPRPLQHRLEAFATAFLHAGPGPALDFSTPAGEPALITADSVSWRVFKNPVTLFIGGIAAVVLELAEPRVRDGVWQHSSFRTDPLGRMRRTGLAAMLSVYGPRSKAEAMIAAVVSAHGRVSGITSEGYPYHANDPQLLDWVQATTGFGFISAYSRYARRLGSEEFDRAYAEAAPAAELFGAGGAPRSRAQFDALFARMQHKLVPSPILQEFLRIMQQVEAFPATLRWLQPVLVRAAIDLLPPELRQRLRIDATLGRWELPLVLGAARAAERLVLRSSPAVQSCRRLGLPDDWLYTR